MSVRSRSDRHVVVYLAFLSAVPDTHVARKFGALDRQVDYTRVNVGRMLDVFRGTPSYQLVGTWESVAAPLTSGKPTAVPSDVVVVAANSPVRLSNTSTVIPATT